MARIYGIDFTSAPSVRKPITCAIGALHDRCLIVDQIEVISSLKNFGELLQRQGPWVGGFDFPFGQPYELMLWLHTQHQWPLDWDGFIERMSTHTLSEYNTLLAEFRHMRHSTGLPRNAKRVVDQQARSISAMLMAYVPVGKMFFRGVPPLKRSGASIMPCHPTTSDRIALEVYPALVARAIIGNQSYKNDRTPGQRVASREQILAGLSDPHGPIAQRYGITIAYDQATRAACLNDPSGDTLDALLAALQAAWATTQPQYGIPFGHEREGWITDPTCTGVS
ncbi:MAG: DUF429 domain-containing protein [Roseiflexaceae bacterium]|nr:DUF429 domain-containing protein [Roseiflexaceae bacterium]